MIIEVDGYDTHGYRRAFENDRRRDQAHVAAGYVVIRITWRQLQDERSPSQPASQGIGPPRGGLAPTKASPKGTKAPAVPIGSFFPMYGPVA